ncbi:hypothetical protein CYLTODRAFT_397715 [Cylindrobasidium torrendii FP15055 ss-10]|uniref:Zn(2)-C6 fungal-type domain-containing protein n=1 Tax=Cylindrobasidium torrendii FP15055 ss-10 TaxID=1314674 RepID=A0A0D7BC80_9AGAR|nr:hypothetical protein CYLTODRAFT_397715 [Cylindrobasidium torrendii FP15055 ss-10]
MNGAQGSFNHGSVLATPSLQAHMHELAKSLPPPRKQNTACDACRSRKVKCHRIDANSPCQHCISKNYPCTNHIQQATSDKKRGGVPSRRKTSLPPQTIENMPPNFNTSQQPQYDLTGNSLTTEQPMGMLDPGTGNQASSSVVPTMFRSSFPLPVGIHSSTMDVIAYLFSPPDDPAGMGYSQTTHIGLAYGAWGGQAPRLADDSFRIEFTLDLVEVFFQIVHSRLPLLNPDQFRAELQLPSGSSPRGRVHKLLHPALTATVLAWGAKFSEHPLLVADRTKNGGQSLLAKTLIDRTRELAESLRVHRIATDEHIIINLLIEPLQSQTPEDRTGYFGFWLASATRHLLDLGVNHKSALSSSGREPEELGSIIFAWWMAVISDAYASMYYRRKPVLDDDDYDIDFYVAESVGDQATPSARAHSAFHSYYTAAHALARTARQMSRVLWKPVTEQDGVPFESLVIMVRDLLVWRDTHLPAVGVSNNKDGQTWDFVTAVSSCASDAQYHVLWIILFNALDEFGVRELIALDRGIPSAMPLDYAEISGVMRRVASEALDAAQRIAALTSVLSSNQYLRLDPAVMHVSCIRAGMLLARFQREEVHSCIQGLRQYAASYEEAGAHADEIARMYEMSEVEFNHMADLLPDGILEGMVVDEESM